MPQQRADDRQQHSDFAGDHAAARGRGRAHPLERENEQSGGDDVERPEKRCCIISSPGSRFLNIFSMRSVIR